MNPLGSIMVMSYKSTEKLDHLRINGDKPRLEAYIEEFSSSPDYRVEMHEDLRCVFGCWTCRFTVHRVAVPVK